MIPYRTGASNGKSTSRNTKLATGIRALLLALGLLLIVVGLGLETFAVFVHFDPSSCAVAIPDPTGRGALRGAVYCTSAPNFEYCVLGGVCVLAAGVFLVKWRQLTP